MVRHIVMWNYMPGFSDAENAAHAAAVQAELTALAGLIPGVVSIQVHIDPLPTSNRAVVLDSVFQDEAALLVYKDHPEHVRVGKLVRSVLTDRACIDYAE